MRTLTIDQLKKLDPCVEGFSWYSKNIKTENIEEILTILASHNWDWCRWLFVRLLSAEQNRQLAIYCAELVIPIFEDRYPNDKRPREAVEAAKLFLQGGISEEELNKKRRAAAAAAADAATYATYAATYAAYAATYAAYAADAAAAAAADAAADAVADAAATYAADAEGKRKIISKVIELLKEMEK